MVRKEAKSDLSVFPWRSWRLGGLFIFLLRVLEFERQLVGRDDHLSGKFQRVFLADVINQLDEICGEADSRFINSAYVNAAFLLLQLSLQVSVSDSIDAEVAGFRVCGLPQVDLFRF